MKFRINYNNGDISDFFEIEGDIIDDIRTNALAECEKRGWDTEYSWSEEIK